MIKISKRNVIRNLGVAVLFVGFNFAVSAATFNVNSFTDAVNETATSQICASVAGSCTLRAAIMAANARPGADTINVPAGDYKLVQPRANPSGNQFRGEKDAASGDLDITDSVTIIGGDPNNLDDTTIRSSGLQSAFLRDRIFHIFHKDMSNGPINVTLRGLTMTGVQMQENLGGGCLLVDAQTFGPNQSYSIDVTIQNSKFTFCFTKMTGGAIANWGGNITIENSIIDRGQTPFVPGSTIGQNGGSPGAFSGGQGGGIANWSGTITIRNSEILNSRAQLGGGIYSQNASNRASWIVIEDSVVSGNEAFMGGGFLSGSNGVWDFAARKLTKYGLIINRTEVTGNVAEFGGGGMYTLGLGSTLVSASTFSGNEVWDPPGGGVYDARGGGIYHSSRVLDIVNSTIAGNSAQESRLRPSRDQLSILPNGGDEIFVDNVSNTGGQNSSSFVFTIRNSIIGDGPPGNDPRGDFMGIGIDDDCNGSDGYQNLIKLNGNNVISGATCLASSAITPKISGKLVSKSLNGSAKTHPVVVGLAELADNCGRNQLPSGGAVKTRALIGNSPAIGAGTGCPGNDQRNFKINDTMTCDIGAFQLNVDKNAPAGNAAPTPQDDVVSVTAGGKVTVAVLLNDRDPDVTDNLKLISIGLATGNGTATANLVEGEITVAAPTNVVAGIPVEVSVNYKVSDGQAEADGELVVFVYAANDNTVPLPSADTFTISQGQQPLLDVLDNDIDKNFGDVLEIKLEQKTSNGGANLQYPNNNKDRTRLIYAPKSGFVGEDQFSYTTIDNRGGESAPTIVKVTVNAPPTIVDADDNGVFNQVLDVKAGETVTVVVKVDDRESDNVSFSGGSGQQGSAVFADASGTLEYTAKSGAAGEDEFSIFVSDAFGSSTATVRVQIEKSDSNGTGGDNTGGTGSDNSADDNAGGTGGDNSCSTGDKSGGTGGDNAGGTGSDSAGGTGGNNSGAGDNSANTSGSPEVNASTGESDSGGGGGALNFLILIAGLLLPLLRRRRIDSHLVG